jgi:hypothetical protein
MSIVSLPFFLGAQSGATTRRRFGWKDIPVEIEDAGPELVQHATCQVLANPLEPNSLSIYSKYLYKGDVFRTPNRIERSRHGAIFNTDGIEGESCFESIDRSSFQPLMIDFSRQVYKKPSDYFIRVAYSDGHNIPSAFGVSEEILETARAWAKAKFLLVDGRLLIKTKLSSLVMGINSSQQAPVLSDGLLPGIHFAFPDDEFLELQSNQPPIEPHYDFIGEDVRRRMQDEADSSGFVWAGNGFFNTKAINEIASPFLFRARSVVSMALHGILRHEKYLQKDKKIWRHCEEILRLGDILTCEDSEEDIIDAIAAYLPTLPKLCYSDQQRQMIDAVLERYYDRPMTGLGSKEVSSIKTKIFGARGF